MSKRVMAAIAALTISGGAALAQEVKVGVVLPYTGIGAEFARQMDRGMELYLKLNPDQVKPYTITIIKRDSKAPSGADAKIAVQELLTQDKVDLLLPPWGTPTHFAVAPLAQKYKVPIVGGTAASVKLREMKNDWFWFVSWMPDVQERALVDLLKDLKVKTAAVAYLQEIFPKENLQFLEPYLKEAGISIALLKDYPVAEKDLKTLLSQIKAKSPDAVICLSYPSDTLTIVTQAQEVGLNPKLMFNLVGPATIAFKPKFGPAVEGITGMGNWSAKMKTFGNKEFVDSVEAR